MKDKFFDWHLNEFTPVIHRLVLQKKLPFVPDHCGDFHAAIHLNIQVTGDSRKRVGNTFLTLKGRTVFLVSPWEPHRTVYSEKGCMLSMSAIDPEQLANSLPGHKERLRSFLHLPPKERHELIKKYIPEEYIKKMIENIYTKKYLSLCRKFYNNGEFDFNDPNLPEYPQTQNELLGVWHTYVGFFVRILSNVKNEELPENNQINYLKLLPALSKVQNAGGRKITVEEAASTCQMAVSTFRKQFVRTIGTPFAKYEVSSRFHFAMQEFSTGRLLLKEIAEKYSFYDMSHFCRMFSRKMGITPLMYLKKRGLFPE